MAIKELFWDQRPIALLDPRASNRLDPRFTFTRNSTATYVGQDGLIKYSGNNEPRITYDSTNSAELGLLLERERTNGFLASEDFTDAYWNVNSEVTITPNAATAPDGSNTASLIVPTAVDAPHKFGRSSAGVNNVIRTYSVFAKAAGYNYVTIAVSDTISRNSAFNLLDGSYIQATAGDFNIAGTQKFANGWWRLWFATDFGSVPSFRPFPTFDRVGGVPWTGDGTSGVYLWGAQWEDTYSYPTSYIPTTSSTVTRAADLLSIDSLSIPSTCSVYIDAQAITAAADDTLISLKNASNQKINLAFNSNAVTYNSLALIASYNGTSKSSLPLPVPTTNRERNIITWGAQNYQYGRDGSRFAPSLSASVPANLTQLSIGHDAVDPTKAFNGYINTVYLWNGELTPAIAEALIRNDVDPINADTFSPVGPAGALSFVINTQGAAVDGSKVFTLPAESVLNDNDIVITWGDNTESGLAGAAAELGAPGLAHTYPAAGIYPVYVEGKLQNLKFNNSADAKDLLEISAWGTTTGGNIVFLAPSTMNSAFYGCTKLQSIPSTNLPDTSAVTDWFRAFRNCSSLTGTFRSFNFSAATTFQEAFYNCSGITSFTAAGDQTQNVTNFSNAWYGCSGLTSFPLINTSAGTNFSTAWFGCSGLTSFPLINTSAGTNFSFAWFGCSGLTSFPLINTAAGTFFSNAWNGCSGLTSFPLINTAAGTNFSNAWTRCTGLTSFPLINTAAGTNFDAAWFGCTGLTSFPLIDTAAGTTFGSAWLGCSGLTSFPLINTAAGTSFYGTWNECSGLTSFPLINTAAGTSFTLAWRNNNGLTSFPALDFDAATGLASDSSAIFTGFRETWNGCSALTAFPPNLFDNTTCTRYLDAFRNCALTAASIENIIVSINAAGTSNGNLSLQGGTNAGASTWTANAVTAYDALVARGWTITRNA